jgi:hypothetical protein
MGSIWTKKEEERKEQLLSVLSPVPFCLAARYNDRKVWENPRFSVERSKIQSLAEEYLLQPDVEITEEIALRFTTIGDRSLYDSLHHLATSRIRTFALAACLEKDPRYLAAYENAVKAFCSFRTWVGTAHDRSLDNFYGRNITIDIFSAMAAWELATADFMLGDLVSAEIRKLIADNLAARIFRPYEEMICGKRTPMHWFTNPTNWNAVCLGGVTGAAMAALSNPERRAFYVVLWEKLIQNFIRGYGADGYCSEGLGYWGYGFSHYMYAAELLREGGYLDVLEKPEILKIAQFYKRTALPGPTYPAIGDCTFGQQPESGLADFLRLRLGEDRLHTCWNGLRIYDISLFWTERFLEKPSIPQTLVDAEYPFRSWFEQAGVLLCRPGDIVKGKLSVCLKGGHNRENHNHNDVGSFTASRDGVQLICDAGHDHYTEQTFSERRYQNQLNSSYGHSVPYPDGITQAPHIQPPDTDKPYAAKVLDTTFSPLQDSLKLDLTPVYDNPQILSLVRSFCYQRIDQCKLFLTDTVHFASPACYETAFITFGTCQIHNNAITISWHEKSILIHANCSLSLEIATESLDTSHLEYFPDVFLPDECPSLTRIRIRTIHPVANVSVRFIIE